MIRAGNLEHLVTIQQATETRGADGSQRVGIVLGEQARRFRSTGCTWEGHADGNVRDLSGGDGAHALDAPR